MKTISIFLALINSLLAGLLIAYSLSGSEIHQAATWWLLTKLLAGLSVIMVGLLTWIGSIRTIKPGLMTLSSLFLVVLGAATVMWTLHLGLVSGDMEYYMFVYGGSLMMQGTASLFGYSGISENMTVV
ncbi:MAG TPA: hypothetical protein VJM08_01120 [Anaerolineales bacterium]|nr:hypothetical protein [Anaerolineales bacterium]